MQTHECVENLLTILKQASQEKRIREGAIFFALLTVLQKKYLHFFLQCSIILLLKVWAHLAVAVCHGHKDHKEVKSVMNSYELLYIIDNDLSDEGKEAIVNKINAVVTDNGGTVDGIDKWGTRKLAYAINYKTEGYYVLVNFSAPATLPDEVERVLRITDGVIRFMVVKK